MNNYSKQKEEIATICNRTFTLNLSDEDARRIAEKAGSVGLTISQLLENFIADLVYGTYSNGSDERMYANEWFDRCGFSMFSENSFLKYLIEAEQIYSVFDLCDNIEDAKKEMSEIDTSHSEESETLSAIKEDIDYWQEQLNEYFTSYQRETKETADSSLTDGIKKVLEWRKENEQFLKR